MTNLYTDPDSKAQLREQAASLLCKATARRLATTRQAPLLSRRCSTRRRTTWARRTSTRCDGKKASEVFGGPLSQHAGGAQGADRALFFAGWLAEQGAYRRADASQRRAHPRHRLGLRPHLARHVHGERPPKPYSQLAAIQLGFLMSSRRSPGRPRSSAANGKDKGCFEVEIAKWKPAQDELARIVLGAKARGDRALAEKTRDRWIGDGTAWAERRNVIQQRWLRAPKASFVYSIDTR